MKQVIGPLTGERFYQLQISGPNGKPLTIFGRTWIEVSHKRDKLLGCRQTLKAGANGQVVTADTLQGLREGLKCILS